MAPQRRAAPKAPEGRAEAERRRPSSSRKDRAPQKGSRVWLQAAGLAAIVAVATLLLWSSLGADDGISGVLARRGEVVARRFIEVPCSEDYDGHQRFEGPGAHTSQEAPDVTG
ncbi:2-oxoglutarate and iron-dependent oxygenase domain-containing protein 3 isoform X2 [Ochotona curzoniae]|uniref:2-oxoglutarate and iron-dependent oxygenase domain-containing protein 3 isoform X2 n=1 Tax=Ochotona curzoniae TaxID=130825 RepID=UPI001B3464B5|nr:2-oxoglutarate and iron-dependent oxygenase domain-containing protein 3 isoform X2 [Ochotona curzoniae]